MCLSIRQPCAALLAHGWLSTNSRWFTTGYRGPVAVHASRGLGPRQHDLMAVPAVRAAVRELAGHRDLDALPRGAVVGVCELYDVTPIAELFQGGTLPPRDAVVLPKIAEGFLLRFRDCKALAGPVACAAEPDLFPLPHRAVKDVLRQLEERVSLSGHAV
jgi:hypothetical protein